MLAVAFFPHRLNATRSSEATLSQELHTTRLLLLHVSVEYQWQHIGLSPVFRPNGYVCSFVSQPSKPDMRLLPHPAFQHHRVATFVNVIPCVCEGVHIGYPYGRYGRGPGFSV